MTEKYKKLKKLLENKLNVAKNELEKAREELSSCSELSESGLDNKIEEIKSELNSKKHGIKETKEKIQAEFYSHKKDVEDRIQDIKDAAATMRQGKHDKKIIIKAGKAEDLAEACIESATISIKQAELACLQACKARAQAEEILSQKKKQPESETGSQ
jgi:hypothetical protein